jgi:hypothetical protein
MPSDGDVKRPVSSRLHASRAVLSGFLSGFASIGLACGNLSEPCKGSQSGACVSQPDAGRPSTSSSRRDGSVVDLSFQYDGGTQPKPHAILVSVDGLGAYYIRQQLGQGKLPNFAALARAGASTLNARADYEYTLTLPNHTSMITGRPVSADDDLPNTTYHGWTINSDVDYFTTLHNSGNPNLHYIASVFDVAHDHGLSTCLYSGKTKFMLFANSYNAVNGAPDTEGEDNGRGKLDRVVITENRTDLLIDTALGDLAGGACDVAFIHIADMDWVGHDQGWGSDAWLSTLDTVDEWIGRIARFADAQETSEPYALVVTADHGGVDYDHSDATLPIDYAIPFYIISRDVPPDTNLYALTGPKRADPGAARPRYSAPLQPVRNADAANVVTALLGLPPVPGSFMRDLLK